MTQFTPSFLLHPTTDGDPEDHRDNRRLLWYRVTPEYRVTGHRPATEQLHSSVDYRSSGRVSDPLQNTRAFLRRRRIPSFASSYRVAHVGQSEETNLSDHRGRTGTNRRPPTAVARGRRRSGSAGVRETAGEQKTFAGDRDRRLLFVLALDAGDLTGVTMGRRCW